MGWVVSDTPRPFYPGRDTQYPLYRRLGGTQGRYGRVRKISPPPRFDHRNVQPVASRYTDCAIPAGWPVNKELDNKWKEAVVT